LARDAPFCLTWISHFRLDINWGNTIFFVYGMEAVLPFEVEIPSMRVLMETQPEEAKWVQARRDQLNFIDEKRLAVVTHGQLYQRRMKKAFDGKVRHREFQESDFVIRKILPIQKDHRGK